MNTLSDSTIEKAAAGDMYAFERVYKETSGFVFNSALRLCLRWQDAEEVTQNIYVKLFKNLRQYKSGTAFKSWLYRVTYNETLNFIKKRKTEKNKTDTLAHTAPAAGSPEMDRTIEDEYARFIISASIRLLPSEFRACVTLREIDGLSYQEIAQTLGIKINTVRTRLRRARKKLVEIGTQMREGTSHEMQ